jgi:hypothetical protein
VVKATVPASRIATPGEALELANLYYSRLMLVTLLTLAPPLGVLLGTVWDYTIGLDVLKVTVIKVTLLPIVHHVPPSLW